MLLGKYTNKLYNQSKMFKFILTLKLTLKSIYPWYQNGVILPCVIFFKFSSFTVRKTRLY